MKTKEKPDWQKLFEELGYKRLDGRDIFRASYKWIHSWFDKGPILDEGLHRKKGAGRDGNK